MNEKVSDSNLETEELMSLAKKVINDEIIPWTDKEIAGISILRNYPNNSIYKPVKYRDGKQDSVALIKIGYWIKSIKNNKTNLDISVSNASRYKFKYLFYDYSNQDSPTESSVKLSEASRQPSNIEDKSRYEIHITNKKIKFYDTKTKKYVNLKIIVDLMYKLHLKTLTNFKFIVLTKIQKTCIDAIEPINKTFILINKHIFGKTIKKSNKFEDYAKGTFTTYKHSDLEDATQDTEKMKILGSDFPISPQSARSFLILFTIIFLIKYWFNSDFTGLISLIEFASNNNFFLLIITSFFLLIIDRLLPYTILFIVNSLIKLRLYLYEIKISIN